MEAEVSKEGREGRLDDVIRTPATSEAVGCVGRIGRPAELQAKAEGEQPTQGRERKVYTRSSESGSGGIRITLG